MSISLTPELDTFVQQKVQSGLYSCASEVVWEALRLLKDRDTIQQQRLAELNREIKTGLDQLDRGEGIPGDQIFAELKQRSQAYRGNSQ